MSQAIASFPLDFNSAAAAPRAAEPARSTREPAPSLASLPLLGPSDWQPRRSKRLLLPVLGLHAVMAWGLVQMGVVPMPSRPAPVEVKLLTVAPPKTPPPAVRPTLAPQFQQLTVPPVEVPLIQVSPSPVLAVVAENPPPRPVVVATPAPAPAGPGPAHSGGGPREVSASAVQYLQAPPIAVPAMSRRLGESGTVVLRVLVDRDGLPRQITLHQSCGFARLDEQAQQAMRAARFKPHTENGEPVEMLVLTPIQYELGR
ncbi:TonB family protein [Mitsuaria sp. WAJ17]|uniref:energy transducer TonB n=1 Tax=Mitsuaria sp. WAJ17 TaxID=2761452 RepID=UPI0016010E3A|nr:energy transducer TonB [Mitsuaria sp. WAJ17]MBB2486790.1 TonB family protein [Mitsuaria sp. WAJ17]